MTGRVLISRIGDVEEGRWTYLVGIVNSKNSSLYGGVTVKANNGHFDIDVIHGERFSDMYKRWEGEERASVGPAKTAEGADNLAYDRARQLAEKCNPFDLPIEDTTGKEKKWRESIERMRGDFH